MALPWIVPRVQRREESYEEIDSFFDRWVATLGTAVIDAGPQDALLATHTPGRVVEQNRLLCRTVYSDGSGPADHVEKHDSRRPSSDPGPSRKQGPCG